MGGRIHIHMGNLLHGSFTGRNIQTNDNPVMAATPKKPTPRPTAGLTTLAIAATTPKNAAQPTMLATTHQPAGAAFPRRTSPCSRPAKTASTTIETKKPPTSSMAAPVAQATTLANTHAMDRETRRRSTSHCRVPTQAPTTAPITPLCGGPPIAFHSTRRIPTPTARPASPANTHSNQKPHPIRAAAVST